MILVISNFISEENFPIWLIPFIIVYLFGSWVAYRGVNKRKKWWQKILFVVFWPFYFAAIMIKLLAVFG